MPFKEHANPAQKAAPKATPKAAPKAKPAPKAATPKPVPVCGTSIFTDPKWDKILNEGPKVKEPDDPQALIETALMDQVDRAIDPYLFPAKGGKAATTPSRREEDPQHMFHRDLTELVQALADSAAEHMRKAHVEVIKKWEEKHKAWIADDLKAELTECMDMPASTLFAETEMPVTQFCKDLKRIIDGCWSFGIDGARDCNVAGIDEQALATASWNYYVRDSSFLDVDKHLEVLIEDCDKIGIQEIIDTLRKYA